MGISISVITDFNEILKIENDWNHRLLLCSENLFLYSRLLCGFMRFAKFAGWTPLVFTFWDENEIIGIIPLKTLKRLGSTYVFSLSEELYSDLFLSNEHHEECITLLVDYLFGTLNCLSVSITFQGDDFYVKKLQKVCENKGFKFSALPFSSRAMVPVNSDWDLFYGTIKSSERKKLRKIKRKLDGLGSWHVFCAELNDVSIKQILSVEESSWKKDWRAENNSAKDYALEIILNESQPKENLEPIYTPEVWFLEINGQTIAYRLILVYKGTASFVKTSYNLQYRKFAPGKFLLRNMLEHFFRKRVDITKLDFVTNLPVMQMWNPIHVPRTTINIERNHLLCSTVNMAYTISLVRRFDNLIKRFFNKKP